MDFKFRCCLYLIKKIENFALKQKSEVILFCFNEKISKSEEFYF